MKNSSNIDIDKSIITERLICKRSWLYKIDKIFFCMFCIPFVVLPMFLFAKVDLNNSNDLAFAFLILPLFILFGVYGFYRKIMEERLIKIITPFTQRKNKDLLLEFLKQKGYAVSSHNRESILVNHEESLSYNGLWTKTFTFIIIDQAVYFNIIKNYPKLNPPVFFTHLFLKKELTRLLLTS